MYYVRQFCFIYFETNLGMKDKMQYNSGTHSSDQIQMTKQKWKNIEIVETIINCECVCNNEDDTNILNNTKNSILTQFPDQKFEILFKIFCHWKIFQDGREVETRSVSLARAHLHIFGATSILSYSVSFFGDLLSNISFQPNLTIN